MAKTYDQLMEDARKVVEELTPEEAKKRAGGK